MSRAAVLRLFSESGAVEAPGPAPRGSFERAIQSDLKEIQGESSGREQCAKAKDDYIVDDLAGAGEE